MVLKPWYPTYLRYMGIIGLVFLIIWFQRVVVAI